MNTPPLSFPLSVCIPSEVKKKRILLVDTSHAKRDLRADVLRKFGIDVDTAVNIAEARLWWKPALYDLVLVNMEKGRGQRDKFCDDLRGATPQQRLAFLVGQPQYLAGLPSDDQGSVMQSSGEQAENANLNGIAPAGLKDKDQRWGILEASRRISAVRSASVARTQAIRALPPPLRDSEARRVKPRATLDDLIEGELP
jgi:CheY-like chemotaxis protein